MKRSVRGIGILSFFAAFCLAAAPAVRAQSADELLKRGDELYARGDTGGALEAYLAAAKADPGRYEALWKTSRSLVDAGDLVDAAEADGKDRQRKDYQDAAEYARKAIAADPNGTWGYHHLAAALGLYGLTQSRREQVKMAKEVRTLIDKAIELDGTNDLAYHALGRWQRRVAEIGGAARLLGGLLFGGLPKGSFEESEAALRKAVELRPDYINHRLELGRTYLALGKNKEAVEEFQKCLDLPAETAKDPGYKKEAEAELAGAKAKSRNGLRSSA